MADWEIKKLSEVAEIIGGGTPSSSKSEYFENGDIAWLTPKDLSGYYNRYISKGERNITKLGLDNSSAKLLPAGSVLLTSRAPIGYVAIAKNPISTNQGFKNLVLKEGHIPEFYYYLLKNNISLLESRATGSTFKEISGQILKDTELNIPTIEIQKKIVDILNPLDEKIELNTQTNQTLEAIAQAIFKSWFVDFDPVRAKAAALSEGKSEHEANLAAMSVICGKDTSELNDTEYKALWQIAEAFPSELVANEEFGEVPKGWEVTSISDKRILEIIKPKINKFEGEKDYIATANVSQNSIVGVLEKITYDTRPSRANMQPIIDSIWFAKMVGEHKAIMVDKNDEFLLKETILSTGFLGINPKKHTRCFLYCFINSDLFTQTKNLLATGAVQIALNNSSFSKIKIVLPDDKVLLNFETKMSDVFSLISSIKREKTTLSKIRNELLPKLLNGEI